MLGRIATGFVAILTFRSRTGCLTGPAKVIDGDTIVEAGELVRLHGIDAPELDQTFLWRGQHVACGTTWPGPRANDTLEQTHGAALRLPRGESLHFTAARVPSGTSDPRLV